MHLAESERIRHRDRCRRSDPDVRGCGPNFRHGMAPWWSLLPWIVVWGWSLLV